MDRKQSATFPCCIEYKNVPRYFRISESYDHFNPRGSAWTSSSLKAILSSYIETSKVSLRSLAEMVGHTYGATQKKIELIRHG